MSPILSVGSVAYDSVKTPFGKVEEVLGGSATYFSVSASFFSNIDLVACVGKDFRKQDVELLESRDINLEGLEYMDGQTFRWKGEYGHDLNEALTLDTQLNVFADFHPTLSNRHQNARYVFLGNIDPALQHQVLSQVEAPQLVVCDTMNYWIEGHWDTLLETLKLVDILLVNESEAKQLAQETNLVKGARKILTWGPKILVVKRGEYGVLMFYMDSEETCPDGQLSSETSPVIFGAPAYPLEQVFDPTGAGDSFAGGFVGYLAGVDRNDVQATRQAIIFGSVMASFCVERFSLERLRELTFTEIEMRYREFREMTYFEDIA